MSKPDIRKMDPTKLEEMLKGLGQPAYRARQVHEWLWVKGAMSFDEMTSLPKKLRDELEGEFEFHKFSGLEEQISSDGTIKSAFKTFDAKVIEGVLIPTEKRKTACISSQIGCSLACKFCATGKLKRLRNLEASEIYDQVRLVDAQSMRTYGEHLTNIVYMGMGEPLLNYKNVMRSVELICSNEEMNFTPKKITVSTAGIARQIVRLGEDNARFNLALSLHAADDAKRSEIMPINDQNNLKALVKAMNEYYSKTKKRLTFEYILFRNFNDSIEDAERLVKLCRKVPSKVNIIEYNSIDDRQFQKASDSATSTFEQYLNAHGVVAKVRRSRGKDIDAACGQLANKNKLATELLKD